MADNDKDLNLNNDVLEQDRQSAAVQDIQDMERAEAPSQEAETLTDLDTDKDADQSIDDARPLTTAELAEQEEPKEQEQSEKPQEQEQTDEPKEQMEEPKEQEKTDGQDGEKAEQKSEPKKKKASKKQAKAKEAQTTGEKDEFGREILEPTFENLLIMSKNAVKLNYSTVKNNINTYKSIKSQFKGGEEYFCKGKEKLIVLRIADEKLLVYMALPDGALDKKMYPHKVMASAEYKDTPLQFTVNSEASAVRVVELIELLMEINEIGKVKVPVLKAYAERYPLKPNAVIRGKEHIPPKEGEYDGEEYQDIQGELTRRIMEQTAGASVDFDKKKGKEKLEDIRQTAKSVNAAIAISEPVVYFYDIALNRDNTIMFINMQQVLNDRFLGKLLPQHYFSIAEGSDRIEKLNMLALEAAQIDCKAKPDTLFAVTVSSKLLIKKEALKRLAAAAKTENENLVLAFDCQMLEALGDIGIKGVEALKEAGVKIMLDNAEQAGIRVLTEYYIDFLRIDNRYYSEDNPKTTSHLDMLIGYAKTQGITTVACNVETTKQALFMLTHGIDGIQGNVIGKPKRLVHIAIKEKKSLPAVGG